MDLGTHLKTSLRLALASWLACALLYPGLLMAMGAALAPEGSRGSLIRDRYGKPVGSALVAQEFTRPEYLWSRPSACGYDGAAASGSNLAPSNPELRRRAAEALARLGATRDNPAPADLVSASGSGLDPHVTIGGALYQAPRIAEARKVPRTLVERCLHEVAERPAPWSRAGRHVNVLRANLELDARFGAPPGATR